MKKIIATLLIMTCFLITATAQTVTKRNTNTRIRPGTERRLHRLEIRRIRRMERRHHRRRHPRVVFEMKNGNTDKSMAISYSAWANIQTV